MGKKYEDVATAIERHILPKWPVCRVISIGESAVLSFRDASGTREALLMGQTDPRVLSIAGAQYTILHFGLEGNSDDPGAYVARFFIKAGPTITVKGALSVLTMLQKLLPLMLVDVKIKTTAWFIEDPQFPSVYPFEDKLVLPPLPLYLSQSSISCGNLSGKTRCSGQGFEP